MTVGPPLELRLRVAAPGTRVDAHGFLASGSAREFDVAHVGMRCAVLRPRGDLDDLVVTDASVGLMPGGLCLTEPHFAPWALLRPGSRVRVSADASARADGSWADLTLGSVPSDPSAVSVAIARLPRAPVSNQLAVGIVDGAWAARTALNGDSQALGGIALHFVGRGMGSTPAGDDLLVGACAGLRSSGETAAADLLAHAARAVVHRTTTAARLYVRAAAAGRFADRVHRLAGSLMRPEDATAAMIAARRWGGSSGVDLAAGFLAAQAVVLGLRLPAARLEAA